MQLVPKIRLAHPDDALPIARMSRDCIECGLGWSWRRDRVLRSLVDDATNVIVAHREATLAGFGIMEYGDVYAHLLLLSVAPSCRRQGLGTHLAGWLERSAVAAGIALIKLEARADCPGAAAFYGRLGYTLTGRSHGYYGGEVDALRFEKRLRPL